jgi:hypothetical protein
VAAVQRAAVVKGKLPNDVLLLGIVLVVVLLGGLAALFFPYSRQRSLNILGVMDKPRTAPSPRGSAPPPAPRAPASPR